MENKEFGFDVTVIYSPTIHIKCLANSREEAIEKLIKWTEGDEKGVVERYTTGNGNLNSLDILSSRILKNPNNYDLGENLAGVEIVPYEYDDDEERLPLGDKIIIRDWGLTALRFVEEGLQ